MMAKLIPIAEARPLCLRALLGDFPSQEQQSSKKNPQKIKKTSPPELDLKAKHLKDVKLSRQKINQHLVFLGLTLHPLCLCSPCFLGRAVVQPAPLLSLIKLQKGNGEEKTKSFHTSSAQSKIYRDGSIILWPTGNNLAVSVHFHLANVSPRAPAASFATQKWVQWYRKPQFMNYFL